MQNIIEKAGVLIEALPYMQSFRGKYVVIKLGGSMMADRDCVEAVLLDIVFMEQVGMRPVLVLGGGPLISAEMKKRGKESVFVHGRRVTDKETLDIARDVVCGEIFPWVAGTMEKAGAKTVVFAPETVSAVTAEKSLSEDGDDLGFVGEPAKVDTELLKDVCSGDAIAVLGPICPDDDGGLLNVNADHIACAVAGALDAEKIVFLSSVKGVLRSVGDEDSLISTLVRSEVADMLADGTITDGMRPKVDSCLEALGAGVGKAHIVDGRTPHSLLLEMFTDEGVGTQIIKE